MSVSSSAAGKVHEFRVKTIAAVLWPKAEPNLPPRLIVIAQKLPGMSEFSRDLGIEAGTYRFAVKEFLPDGVISQIILPTTAVRLIAD